MTNFVEQVSRYILPLLGLVILAYCVVSLLRYRAPRVEPAQLLDRRLGDEISITSWETSIGRSNACDVVLVYPTVSRFHAVITKQRQGWIITDTNSQSGTYVNDKKIEGQSVIEDGDVLSMGEAKLIFKTR